MVCRYIQISRWLDNNDDLLQKSNLIEYHYTKTQRGGTAIQIGTDLFRVQKRNRKGTVRWTCTSERCNASFTMLNEEIIRFRNKHNHCDRVFPHHVVDVVDQFKKAVKDDLCTPIPQVYDRFVKKFVRRPLVR